MVSEAIYYSNLIIAYQFNVNVIIFSAIIVYATLKSLFKCNFNMSMVSY